MLGRWQPWHFGHQALFERAIAKTGQVVIQVRDCQGVDDNPFNFDEVREGILAGLHEGGYSCGYDFIIQLVPNITNITYGRGVGYTFEEEVFNEEITHVSGTQIRKQMREEGKLNAN